MAEARAISTPDLSSVPFANRSLTSSGNDLDLFFHCWRLFNCESCLGSSYPCSWCSVSQTCVPNARLRFPFAILAPIRDENICPMGWRERWEMRAKPFSCRCSTMTLMSVVVAVFITLAGVLIIWLLAKLFRWIFGKWTKRQPGWWQIHRHKWSRPKMNNWHWNGRRKSSDHLVEESNEREPLLG